LDDSRIFATGISDGGAMAERLACERSTRIAAIASVAAGNQVADREGFAVVFPNGVPGDPFEDARSWNAGGGSDGFQCISGDACKNGSDDVKYLDAVHEELERALVLDDSRIFATGISDGGAMAERLACERSTRIAAIAPVAAGNQVAEVQGCSTALPVPVLEIHGSTDPCWNFAQGKGTCLQDDGGVKVGVNETIAGWVERNGCVGDVSNETIKDVDKSDGTTSSKEIHGGCVNDADVVLLKVQGGGHTWPGGFQYDGQGTIGAVARDFSASSEVWSFFKAHPRPPLE
ncbi:MAG TPA: hypothetical protein VGO62_00760, partial [Myxococcota bacterium]